MTYKYLPEDLEIKIFSYIMGVTYKNKRCKATKLDGKVCTRKTKASLLCRQHKLKLSKNNITGLKLIAHKYILMYPSIKRKNWKDYKKTNVIILYFILPH